MQDVIDLDYVCQLWVADELSIPLLRHNAGEPGQFETVIETHTVHHRIPLVPEYILEVDTEAKSITVKLPAGFIRLGREELYIRVLKRELKPYIAHLPNKFREKVRGERELPRYNDLREQGRSDLVSLMKLAGGPAQVQMTNFLVANAFHPGHAVWRRQYHCTHDATRSVYMVAEEADAL